MDFHIGGFDSIFMNPPFENLQDVDHVRHAYALLAEGGELVAVMSESPFFRMDKKAVDFRAWLDEIGGYSEQLPAGSFQESGTGVQARLVHLKA
jgi:16S rRNA G1207 methylase RsmC